MRISDVPNPGQTWKESRAAIIGTCLAIAAAVILPNLFLFSVDDMMILSVDHTLNLMAHGQAREGRYALSALCQLLHWLGGTRIDLEIIGAVSIGAGFTALFRATTRLMKVSIDPVEFVLAFAIFMTCGLLMDVFSFTNVWVQSGAASLALAAALSVSISRVPLITKILATAVFGWIAMGFYQIFPYMVACSLLGAFVGAAGFGNAPSLKQIRDEYAPVAIGSLLAIALYFLTNKALSALGVAGFEVFARPVGPEYVRANLPLYFATLRAALNPFGGPYAQFNSKIVIAMLVVGLGSIVWKARPLRVKGLVIAVIVLVVLMLPNPTNILMKSYWPSQRSLSPIAIFVALALLAAASHWTKTLGGATLGRWMLIAAVASQGIVYLDQQKMRFDQQIADFAMAKTIITRAYEAFGRDETPRVKINFDWQDNVTARVRSYDFASSLFATPWSLRALFVYLSNDKVTADVASPEDCAAFDKRLTMKRVGDVLLVCSMK